MVPVLKITCLEDTDSLETVKKEHLDVMYVLGYI